MGRADLRAAVLAGVIAATLVSGCSPAAVDDPATAVPTSGVPARTSSTTATAPPESWRAARARVGESLMRARAAAVGTGDRRAWLAGVEGGALRADQEKVFARIQTIGVIGARLRSIEETVPPIPSEPGTPVSWDARATLEYRVKGYDEAPRTFTLDLTFTAAPARALETAVITGSRPGDRPEPWDLAGLQVRRSGRALVLAVGGRSAADEMVRRADVAARQVSSVLGSAEAAVWIVPATDVDAAQLLGREAAGLDGVAAATDGPIGPQRPAGADRIVIVPGAWSALSRTGRDVVMAHELTHATTRRTSLRQPPLWLSEGLAEFVAYRGLDVAERDLVKPALDRVRSDGLPTDLPTSADFEAAADVGAAYGLSLILARTIADRHGTDGLVRLFRAVNDGAATAGVAGDADDMVDHFLRSLLGADRRDLVLAWRSRLARLTARQE